MKNDYILTECLNKTVLDLGCASNDLHDKINSVAKSVTGVDIIPKDIQGDVERLHEVIEIRGKMYDVIVAGDIIEHLFNPGLFLTGLKPFCHADTKIIITTPNAMALYYFWPTLWRGEEICREDHTCWYTMRTLCQLLEMKGFSVTSKMYTDDLQVNGLRPLVRRLFHKLFPHMGYRLIVTCNEE